MKRHLVPALLAAAVLSWPCPLPAQTWRPGSRPASMPVGGDLNAALADLARQVAAVQRSHADLYLGAKKVQQAASMPAVLWHIGEPTAQSGDLTSRFEPAYMLGFQPDANKLAAMVASADRIKSQAEELTKAAASAAESARQLAARRPAGGEAAPKTPPSATPRELPAAAESELDVLLGLFREVQHGPSTSLLLEEHLLQELAGRLEHLADLDRWLAVNCTFLHQNAEWIGEPGTAPRTLGYSLQARFADVGAIQSRVEDILVASPAEKSAWRLAVLQGRTDEASKAQAAADMRKALAALREQLPALRKEEAEADRKASDLSHARKFEEAAKVRNAEWAPTIVKVEYAECEAAILEGAVESGFERFPAAGEGGRCLSLAARAALRRIEKSAGGGTVLPRVLVAALDKPYYRSYLDLVFYQSAALGTEEAVGKRLSQWLALTKQPDLRGLLEILHPTPGAMTMGQRSDNSYLPQILEWAGECRGADAATRFKEAHALANAFYQVTGYNSNKPVHSMREVIEDKLVDCISACEIQGAIAANAGVNGIVPVRYWRERNGHTILGLRTKDGVMVMDPLTGGGTRKFPGGYPDVVTVETAVPSFGSYVVNCLEIVSKGKVLRMDVPYLDPQP